MVASEAVGGVLEILNEVGVLAVDVLEVGAKAPGDLKNADAARAAAVAAVVELVPGDAAESSAASGDEVVLPESRSEEALMFDTTKHGGDMSFVEFFSEGGPVFFFGSVATD